MVSLQDLSTVGVLAVRALYFQAVGTRVTDGIEFPQDLRESNTTLTQVAERPFTKAASRVFQVDVNHPINDLLDVLRRIDILVVVVDVPRVVIDTQVGVIDYVKEFPQFSAVSRRTLMNLQCKADTPLLCVIGSPSHCIHDSGRLIFRLLLSAGIADHI